jgi:hypothetical protein
MVDSLPPPPPTDPAVLQRLGMLTERPSLEALGRPQMYPENGGDDYREELKRMHHQLVADFAALLRSLLSGGGVGGAGAGGGGDGSTAAARIKAIEDRFTNIHYLLNQVRPQLAFSTVTDMLQLQIEKRRAATAAINEATEKAVSVLEGIGQDGPVGGEGGGGGGVENEVTMGEADGQGGGGEEKGEGGVGGGGEPLGALMARLDEVVAAARANEGAS